MIGSSLMRKTHRDLTFGWILLIFGWIFSSCTQPGVEKKQAALEEVPAAKADIEKQDDPVPEEENESTPEPAEVAGTNVEVNVSQAPSEPEEVEDKFVKVEPKQDKEEKAEPEPNKIQEEPWKTAQKKRIDLQAEVKKSRDQLMSKMRKSLQDKQKLLNESRKLRQKVNKAKRDKGPEFKGLNREMEEIQARIKEQEKNRKSFQDQLKDLQKKQSDGFRRINDWSRKEVKLFEKQKEKERKQREKKDQQPEPALTTGPIKEGKPRLAQIRSINIGDKVLNLFGESESEGYWNQVFLLGEKAAILINQEPGELEAIPIESKISFWVHPDDGSTITWLEAITK
jgi:hypothetical protein